MAPLANQVEVLPISSLFVNHQSALIGPRLDLVFCQGFEEALIVFSDRFLVAAGATTTAELKREARTLPLFQAADSRA